MTEKLLRNQAFVDGQNLYMDVTEKGWKIDLFKFRVYLRDQYGVKDAYYFLGVFDEDNKKLYDFIQRAGFILVFREHKKDMAGRKKGNVDTDIVFTIMAKIAEREKFDRVILISGDGDYYKMVDYLIKKRRFGKLLSPNRHSTSSLYRAFTPRYVDFLDKMGVKKKIEYKKK